MRLVDGKFEMVESILPLVKRDIFLEMWLGNGDYIIVPKSTKLNHFMFENPFNENHD